MPRGRKITRETRGQPVDARDEERQKLGLTADGCGLSLMEIAGMFWKWMVAMLTQLCKYPTDLYALKGVSW